MKTLILVRHAKSSWDTEGMNDIERPLNSRGKKDAPEMAKRLKERKVKIDIFLSSTAKRAFKTAKYFAKEFEFGKKDIVQNDKLYEASVSSFYDVVHTIKDKNETAIIFSHNPGITEFANTLTKVHIDDMPTCAVFAVQANTNKWEDFKNSEKEFLFFDYPKSDNAS
jgi:phosphohistidine phosphatase